MLKRYVAIIRNLHFMLRHYVAASLSAVDRCFDGFVIAIVVGCVCLWGCLFVRKIKNVVGDERNGPKCETPQICFSGERRRHRGGRPGLACLRAMFECFVN